MIEKTGFDYHHFLFILQFSLMASSKGLLKHGIVYKPFPKQALIFTCLQYKSFENTSGKGEIGHTEK